MKKLLNSFLTASFVFFAIGISAQPEWPCAPDPAINPNFPHHTTCPDPPAPCTQQSHCVPDPEGGGPGPIGDAIPLDGASTLLLILGIGIIGGRKIAEQVKVARKDS